ncbi:cytochrome c oxidase subunit 3 [Roseimicrobium sp. ORNL1]|uniref:cytochrome c oxidase subunit 3 n=1 Tax=Roseimicrobium sp. ORNL1 TaxID=2711231 RepID=UPI001F0D0818|nr:cytochrome c oxidase subunit 3 [Roseimicrobium sp. ORNL1]
MEIPYTVKARPDTGLWNAKIGVWLFLASEVMLFGGLFSAYIFLRLAPEGPWPVQVLVMEWGFVNTLILILSSVTVLQAWVALKLRKFNLYRIWMALTILCALAFLGIKSVEYNDKFHHYGVRLHDGSVMEGHLPKDEKGNHTKYTVSFENVTSVTLSSRPQDMGLFGWSFFHNGSDGDFLNYLTDGEPRFKFASKEVAASLDQNPDNEITLDSATVAKLMNAARSHYNEKGAWAPIASVELTAVKPLKFAIPAGRMFDNSWTEKNAFLRDGTVLAGKLADDDVKIEVDKLDFRWLFPHHETNEERAFAAALNADLWKHMGADLKAKFKLHREFHLKEFHAHHPDSKDGKEVRNPMLNDDFVRNTFSVKIETLEGYKLEGGEKKEHSSVESSSAASRVAAATEPAHGAEAAHGAGHGAHEAHRIPHKEIEHFSNFTPKWHNYYAIYFCITGLHGLHVLAGAIVLTYFLLFGKKLYDKDPEHMANRVEVGGLFWHFVDLVWIFLFPLLYLL